MSQTRHNPTPAGRIEPLTYPIIGAAMRLGVGRTKLHELINAGEVRLLRIGGMPRVPESEIQRFIAERMAAD